MREKSLGKWWHRGYWVRNDGGSWDVWSDCRLGRNLTWAVFSRGKERAIYVSESQSPGFEPKYTVGKWRVLRVCVRAVSGVGDKGQRMSLWMQKAGVGKENVTHSDMAHGFASLSAGPSAYVAFSDWFLRSKDCSERSTRTLPVSGTDSPSSL